VLADEWLTASAEEAAEDQRDDQGIVELTGDRDEVGYEVEGKREIARQGNKQRLLRRGTCGSPSSRPQRTMQSGMNPASARALSRLPAMTSARTSAA
jgi:hypothetical protein